MCWYTQVTLGVAKIHVDVVTGHNLGITKNLRNVFLSFDGVFTDSPNTELGAHQQRVDLSFLDKCRMICEELDSKRSSELVVHHGNTSLATTAPRSVLVQVVSAIDLTAVPLNEIVKHALDITPAVS